MKEVLLTKGYTAMIDDADCDLVSGYKWIAIEEKRSDGTVCSVYARAFVHDKITKRFSSIEMHRLIMGLVKGGGIFVDHIDHNALNNQRANLRGCSALENSWNKRKMKTRDNGLPKGVTKRNRNGFTSYEARIKANGKHVYLGQFKNVDDAHNAYIESSKKHHGEFACAG